MKAIVLSSFRASDNYDFVYEEGKEYEFEEERALTLIEKGLVAKASPSPSSEAETELFPEQAKKTKKGK